MAPKKLNKKDWERLQALNARLAVVSVNPQRQSADIWRGDWRAIQWAVKWIREASKE